MIGGGLSFLAAIISTQCLAEDASKSAGYGETSLVPTSPSPAPTRAAILDTATAGVGESSSSSSEQLKLEALRLNDEKDLGRKKLLVAEFTRTVSSYLDFGTDTEVSNFLQTVPILGTANIDHYFSAISPFEDPSSSLWELYLHLPTREEPRELALSVIRRSNSFLSIRGYKDSNGLFRGPEGVRELSYPDLLRNANATARYKDLLWRRVQLPEGKEAVQATKKSGSGDITYVFRPDGAFFAEVSLVK